MLVGMPLDHGELHVQCFTCGEWFSRSQVQVSLELVTGRGTSVRHSNYSAPSLIFVFAAVTYRT